MRIQLRPSLVTDLLSTSSVIKNSCFLVVEIKLFSLVFGVYTRSYVSSQIIGVSLMGANTT